MRIGVITLVLLVCGRTKFPSRKMEDCRGRIVGGKVAVKGSQPWIAAIYRDGKFVCGGSLLNDEWVLTGNLQIFYWQRFIHKHSSISLPLDEKITLHVLFTRNPAQGLFLKFLIFGLLFTPL